VRGVLSNPYTLVVSFLVYVIITWYIYRRGGCSLVEVNKLRLISKYSTEVSKVVVGKEQLKELLLVALIAGDTC